MHLSVVLILCQTKHCFLKKKKNQTTLSIWFFENLLQLLGCEGKLYHIARGSLIENLHQVSLLSRFFIPLFLLHPSIHQTISYFKTCTHTLFLVSCRESAYYYWCEALEAQCHPQIYQSTHSVTSCWENKFFLYHSLHAEKPIILFSSKV